MIMVVPQNNPHPAFNDFKAPPSKSAMAITALVLGIIALITSFLPIINNLSFVLVILGVVFSIVGLVGISRGKKSGKGIAIAALVICVLSGVIVLATQSMYSAALDQATSSSVGTTASSDQVADASGSQNNASSADDVPVEHQNALEKAQSYSDMMYMSKKGLYDQLTSEYGEQFSAEAADYAIEHINADWKANALEKARQYQDQMNMSPSAIHDQLTSEYGEQFTQDEADYAIENL